jgi:hypothetical protein
MPLRWDVAKIHNHEKVTTVKGKERGIDSDPEGAYWNPVTEGLVWYCMVTGIPAITEKTLDEFYIRMLAHDRLGSPLLLADGKPRPITYAEVRAHIGLHTNASILTQASFRSKIYRIFVDETLKTIREEKGKTS